MMFGQGGRKYLSSALRVALGAGTVLGGAFIISRIKDKQSMEARIERLEQMVQQLSTSEEK